MILTLSPAPVRLLGHAVHRAPHTERDQQPGHGAAWHGVGNNKNHTIKKKFKNLKTSTEESVQKCLDSRLRVAEISVALCGSPPASLTSNSLLSSFLHQCGPSAQVTRRRESFIWAWLQPEVGGPNQGEGREAGWSYDTVMVTLDSTLLLRWGKTERPDWKCITHR